ncbi:MAG: alpha/beta hydrolase [Proteobacteria bacterium]|nr:alpha/beta hydrolase [Pseudomonadota bacterium]
MYNMKYKFGSFELNIRNQQLLCDGVPINIEPQVFDLLAYLAENADTLVTQDDLIESVWRGRIVSDSAISARISAARAAVGDSGSRQEIIKTIPRKGFRFIAEVKKSSELSEKEAVRSNGANAQKVRYCTSFDGTRIGYATTGKGQPFVRTGHWLTHLEHDWQSPLWRPILDELGGIFTVTRYDQRGTGLSEWSVEDFSLERCLEDLEAVIEAAGLERFILYGTSQGAPTAIAFAARHPEMVSHLILHGGYVQGRLIRGTTEERELGHALLTLIRHGWGKQGSAFIKGLSSMFIPEGTKEQIDSLVETQRLTTTAGNAALLREAVDNFDVSDLLDSITSSTLVIHARNDSVQPFEQGQELAANIKDAQLVMLDSPNHALLKHEPSWDIFFNELREFSFTDLA